jgi:hypothetical protein
MARFSGGTPPAGNRHVDCDRATATSCEVGEYDMKVRFGARQALVSSAVFAVIVMALVMVDANVRDRFSELVSSGGASSWGDRASVLGNAVFMAARHQSIENAPLVVFATAGALLFLFMVRT